MRRLVLPALAMLAGCVGAPKPTRPAAMPSPVGLWLAIVPGGDAFPLGCDSDAPLLIDADGRYATYGDVGEWTLRGGWLNFLTTEPSAVFADVRARNRHAHAIRFVGRDEMWLDGVRHRRCPPR